MALYTVSTGNTIQAQDVNQVVNVLQRASGQQEIGKYFLAGPTYANGALVSQYMSSISRNTTPVSVSIDTADQAPAGGMSTTPNTGNLTANGFQVWTLTTTTNLNSRAAGNMTIQY
jgi:hypothetical protein